MEPEAYIRVSTLTEQPLPPQDYRAAVRPLAGEVADLRNLKHRWEMEKDKATGSLQASPLYHWLSECKERLDVISLNLAAKEADLRQGIMDLYYATGEKSHPCGVVKETTCLHYDPKEALNWCAKGYLPGLSLNVRAFETAAKHMDLDFVSKDKAVSVALKSDLSEFLEPQP